MKKIKHWFFNRFLPVYLKELLLTENEKLRARIADLERQLLERDAYIDGLQAGIKSQRRIVINAGEVKK